MNAGNVVEYAIIRLSYAFTYLTPGRLYGRLILLIILS